MISVSSVCLCVCVCRSASISWNYTSNLCQISVRATYGRGSGDLLPGRFDMLRAAGFMHVFISAHDVRNRRHDKDV